MTLLIDPPKAHWSRVPAGGRSSHTNNDYLSARLVNNSTAYLGREGEVQAFTVRGGYGFGVFDGTGERMTTLICTSRMIPKVTKVPFNTRWRLPAGTDGNIYIVDRENDVLYMVWGARYTSWIPGFLFCNDAGSLTLPLKQRDQYGRRKDSKIRAKYSEYLGNHVVFNGAGVILRPVTKAALDLAIAEDREDLGHSVSFYAAPNTFGVGNTVWCPASKTDGNPIEVGNVGGVCFNLFMSEVKFNHIIGSTRPQDRPYTSIILRTLINYGGSIDLTAPTFGVVCDDLYIPQKFSFNLKDPGIGVRILQPCRGRVEDEPWSTAMDWCDTIQA